MKRMIRQDVPAVEAGPDDPTRRPKEGETAEREEYRPEETEKKIGSALFFGLLIGLVLSFFIFLFAPAIRDYVFWILPPTISENIDASADAGAFRQQIKAVEKKTAALQKKRDALIPREPYLIVDTSGNQIFVMKGTELIHRGVCSTGSYVLLRAARNKQWIFRTPRGQFKVQTKLHYPVWYMPDWAFVEEGRPVPPRDSPLRFEEGVLGEYGLAIGNGYLIHGTLYKRFLGMPVTHGCVRLDDDDLTVVWKNLQLGSKVLIY